MEFTVNQIAQLAGGTVEGNGEALISEFAKIEEGAPGALSFLANPKYTPYIYKTRSTAVLVRRDFEAEAPIEATLIRVDDPYTAVAHLLTIAQSMLAERRTGIEQPSFIDATATIGKDVYVGAFAYVGPGAVVADNVEIHPQAFVGANVTIGAGATLYPGAKVYPGCRIGAGCIIHAGAVIGADGFGFAPDGKGGYEKIPQIGIVEIGDDVEIGANTTIDRATMGATRIHAGAKLDNLIQIGHNVEIGSHTVMAAQSGVAGSTKVGDNCMVGGQAGLAGHIHVGDGAQFAAQTGVHTDVAAGQRLIGSPAEELRPYGRQVTALKHLPEMLRTLRKIEKQLAEQRSSQTSEK
ncbi:MAG: UDP-3-O-(3-hydroxymyristoyl)glucosamine N-acyltransferase [Pseudoflavonifractor sp.]|nr:UDP-3-O-(3-hydroxymyristoyl)glucosamine N-acyltransferase [Alloprevotella sp.]MCM1117180.1 UDP-3-O-(3-hydroxymyristoyl)glucosamine N-acyltransferase [Pseudoflavonifractor sp.]